MQALQQEVPASVAASAAVTMEGIAEMLADLTHSREAEGRIQLYRLQEQYEAKLEAMQVSGAGEHH